MYSRIRSAVCLGIEGREVYVETDISKGLPSINVVGLAQTTVMESKDRIKSAVINSGFEYPRTRITVNLMPAELKKSGSSLDLPMALGILACTIMPETAMDEWPAVIGELALDGRVSSVRGALPMMIHLKKRGVKKVIVPEGNKDEALISGIDEIYPVQSLQECVEAIMMPERALKMEGLKKQNQISGLYDSKSFENMPDFEDISGQDSAKRAVLVAAAGRHGLLMVGSPGCGKTMLACRIPSVMPAMSSEELIQAAVIRSISSGISQDDNSESGLINPIRPFRNPHHTIGPAGLLGGGSNIALPGEITLAHNGSLITANHALQQGRPVYAVPGPINSQFSIGCNLLIRDGAAPLVIVEDIIRDLKITTSTNLSNSVHNDVSLEGDELEIYEALSTLGGATIDELVRETGKSASLVNAVVTVMEIKGISETYAGRVYISNK